MVFLSPRDKRFSSLRRAVNERLATRFCFRCPREQAALMRSHMQECRTDAGSKRCVPVADPATERRKPSWCRVETAFARARTPFRCRDGRRSHSQNDVATATIPAVVHVESAGSEPCGLDRCINPEHADVAKVDEADAAGTV